MNKHMKMNIAFWLNLCFALLEAVGGWLTGSIAILSDAIHDLGDSLTLGVSIGLERLADRQTDPKKRHRYSVSGNALTAGVLIVGSLFVLVRAVIRLQHPIPVHSTGMIVLAVFGILINGAAVWLTGGGETTHHRLINLHLLEDVLGWVAVLVGAVVMKLTGWTAIDPILSIVVAVFVLVQTIRQLIKPGELHHHH